MAKEVALMNKDKVIAYLEYYPQIDGEIAERRRNRNELDMAYAPAGAIQYDGMPKGKNHISRPTEDIAIDMPDFVRKEIRSYTESIEKLQRLKVEILREVSRLALKQKMVVFSFYFYGLKWEQVAEQVEDEELMKRRERYNCEVPEEVLYLTAGVDTQDDRFEVEVVGWGPDYENWGIKYAVIYGDNSNIQNQVWKDLDVFLSQTFHKPDGTKMKIVCTCIDSGGHRSNQVYRFCKERFNRRVFAIRGSNDSAAAYIQKPTKNNREQAYLFTLGVDTGKSLLLQRLKVEEEGPGFCHFPKDEKGKPYSPRGYDEKYFKGLTSEKQVLHYKRGKAVFEWVLKDLGEHKRNEALDCRNYATAAIEIYGMPLKKPDQQTTQQPKVRKRRGRRSTGGIV